MAGFGSVGPDEIRKDLFELESRYGMETADFLLAFRNGELHETGDFRRWAHLSAAWGLFERRHALA